MTHFTNIPPGYSNRSLVHRQTHLIALLKLRMARNISITRLWLRDAAHELFYVDLQIRKWYDAGLLIAMQWKLRVPSNARQ